MTVIKNGCICGGDYYTNTEQCDDVDCNSERKKERTGTLRVWWIPQVPSSNPFQVDVKTVLEGKKLLDTLANYDLYQLEHNIKPDFSNAGGLEEYSDGVWIEWESEDGEDIDSYNKDEEEEEEEVELKKANKILSKAVESLRALGLTDRRIIYRVLHTLSLLDKKNNELMPSPNAMSKMESAAKKRDAKPVFSNNAKAKMKSKNS